VKTNFQSTAFCISRQRTRLL